MNGQYQWLLMKPKRFLLLFISAWTISAPIYAENPEQDMALFLELSINGVPTHHVALVDYQHPYYYLNEGDLQSTPIQLDAIDGITPGEMIPINAYEDVLVTYDESLQTLDIHVPAHWLPQQRIGVHRERIEAQQSRGVILNYDLYLSKSRDRNAQLNLWNEFRTFGDAGVFSNSGVYSRSYGRYRHGQDDQYRRYDTFWESSNEEKLYTTRVGDLITRPLSWSSSARLGGAQWSHNFALRPDIITHPLPEFSGEVGLPSTLDLMINGSRYHHQNINPGPYYINQVTHLSGAGEAVVITTDALGRTVSMNVPFYVTSQLLKKGLLDYTVSTGSIREHYGQKNFSYSRYALDASFRYGLNDHWTIEGHSEMAASLQVLGAGLVTNIGRIGVINASVMGTRYAQKSGTQLYLAYEYQHPQFGVRGSYRKRNKYYRDIATIDTEREAFTESMQLSFNKSLAEFGSMSLGYFSAKAANSPRQNRVSFGWSKSLREYGNISTYLNYGNNDQGLTASIQWSIPLGEYGSMVATTNRDRHQRDNYGLSYSRGVQNDGGFGWRANYNRFGDQADYFNGAVTYRHDQMQIEMGLYGTRNQISYWGDLSGSVIFMDQQFLFANSVSDSFVLVSTAGAADVGIKYENSKVGKTDKNGYLLVNKVPSYYDAKYEIDATSLPFNMQAELMMQRVAVKSGGGYTLEFPIRMTRPMTLALWDSTGNVIEIGSHVVTSHQEDSFVGWDGIVFFEHLAPDNELIVALPSGRSCRVSVTLADDLMIDDEGITHLGNYTCRES